MTVTQPASTLMSRSARRAISRAAAVAFIGVVPVVGCECRDLTPLNAEAPALIVDVCAFPANPDAQGKQIGGTEECALDFGDADLTIKTERFIKLSNPGPIDLKMELSLNGDPDFDFIGETPTTILAGLSVQVGVRIRPRVKSAITTEIVIVSNADNVTKLNDDGDPVVIIPVTLNGVDNGLPEIEIIPEASCGSPDPLGVDFDFAALGGIKICNVTVRNNGVRDLFFDGLEFVDVNEPAGSNEAQAIRLTGTPPGPDVALPPTKDGVDTPAADVVPPLVLRLAFSPDVLGRYDSTLRFSTSDPNDPVIDMPVTGKGVVGPTCVAEIKSVNTQTSPPFSIEPLDDVTVTAGASTGANADIEVVSTRWDVTERGAGSTVVLSDPNSTETGFLFANRRGLDVAGRYEACAVVTDDLGVDSTNRCCVAFEAIPSQSFLVQMTWANRTGDMDMHVTKRNNNGEYCVTALGQGDGVEAPFSDSCANADDFDCYYGNCKPDDGFGGGTPEWDGVNGRTIGDPSLDIDDTNGFGPENTNVDVAVAGSYGFGVSTFRDADEGTTLVTMRLFLFGRLSGEWTKELDNEFWEVGAVHFTDANPTRPCVEDLTDGDPDDDCPGL